LKINERKKTVKDPSIPEKVVLITGGSGGVGAATATLFLAQGALVMLADINAQRLETTSKHLAGLDETTGTVDSLVSDVTRVADCEAAVAHTVQRFGRLDVLVNTAGVWVEGDSSLSTEKEWDWVMDVNLKGTYFMCSRAIPELKKTAGCIVNLSSDVGVLGHKEAAIYCASKGGVNLLTKALAIELAPDQVRVNAVCPADIMSPMLQYQADTYGNGNPEAYFNDLLAQYPQGEQARFITPEEVAALILYLSSPPARPITGATLSIDYGSTAGL
jgi:NAD(P)-dependent dehydrogenase (short-subunit alcohol dehydrogenase family)